MKQKTPGDALATWRRIRGLSITEAAAALGVTRQCYWRWEARHKKHPISMNFIHHVSRVTGLPLRVLRPDRFVVS